MTWSAGRRSSRTGGDFLIATGASRRRGWRRAAPWAALLLLALVLLAHVLSYWVLVDDAFIAFRYAENLSRGLGLVFNEGERVEGYTDFLWVMLLAGAHTLGASTPETARVLGAVFAIATLPVVYHAGRRYLGLGEWVALLPCGIVVASAPVAMWSGGGLETSLYMLLFTLALGAMLRDLRADSAVPVSGLVFGLATLTRPEAAGLFAVGWAYALVFRLTGLRTLLGTAVGFGIVFVPHFVFRLLYYGYLLPNTFYAKTSASGALVQDGLQYLGEFLWCHGVWALPALAGLALGGRFRERMVRLLPIALLGAAACYIVVVGGDIYPFSRFCAPYLPWLALLLCAGAQRLGAVVERRRLGAASSASVSPVLVIVIAVSVMVPAKLWPDARYRREILEYGESTQGLRDYGLWLRQHRPPDTTIAISSLGRVPYYSGLETIDMLGLADTHIAHREMELAPGFLGHQKYDSEYILSRSPDIVVLEFGTREADFDPRTDLHTEKIFRRVLPSQGWWPAPSDLIQRAAFRMDYAPRAAEVSPGLFFIFFERDETLRNLEMEIEGRWGDPRAHFELAMRYRLHGLLPEAIREMRRAAEIDPSRLEPQLNVAYLFYEAGRYGDALEELRSLQERIPGEERIVYGIALNLHKLERYAEALPVWRQFLEMAPGSAFAGRARRMLDEAQRRMHGADPRERSGSTGMP